MEDLDAAKRVEYLHVPLWGRLVVNVLGAIFAYILTHALAFAFAPPGIFMYFIFFSTLALALVLPHLRYKKPHAWIGVTCLFLVIWVSILFVITPIFTKKYFLAETAKIIPTYSDAKVSEITYLTYGAFGLGKSVTYQYQTKTVNEDYVKMRDLYEAQLGQHEYDVTETTDTSITFQKHNDASPTIFLRISKKHPDTIEVSVDQ